MKKYIMMVGIVAVILITTCISGCTNQSEKDKFIGSWRSSNGGTITFSPNNSVAINGSFGNMSMSGTYMWDITQGGVTFSTNSEFNFSLKYQFLASTTLKLADDYGHSIILTKIV